jgi:hypothetical protein
MYHIDEIDTASVAIFICYGAMQGMVGGRRECSDRSSVAWQSMAALHSIRDVAPIALDSPPRYVVLGARTASNHSP